jgi:AGCS family alanine or glycine:cation symporter
MLGPFIDTIIICTLTGLVIIVTEAWHHTEFFVTRLDPNFAGELFNSSLLTSFAFKEGLSWFTSFGDKIVTISVLEEGNTSLQMVFSRICFYRRYC